MSILFCTPCYGGMVTAQHWYSTLALKQALDANGIDHGWAVGRNESLVHRARMEQAREFLASGYSHMMTVDADIDYTADDVAKLWNLGVDIACAAYCMKIDGKPLSAWKDGKLVKVEELPAEPFEIDYAGTGFLLVSRRAVQGVIDYLTERERKCKEMVKRLFRTGEVHAADEAMLDLMLEGVAASYEGPNGRSPAIYMTPIHNDCLESEDYFFCRIAREAGFKVIMDPSIKLGHWGQYRYA